MEVGAGRLDDDRDGDVWLTFILSTTKDLAKPGNGSLWAQILRPGLRMTIPTQEFLSSPPLVSREPSCLLFPSSFLLLTSYFLLLSWSCLSGYGRGWPNPTYAAPHAFLCHPRRSSAGIHPSSFSLLTSHFSLFTFHFLKRDPGWQ
jgi:hypothetical protein